MTEGTPSITAAREAVLRNTADILLTARRTAERIPDLPAELQPQSEAEAFYVQDVIAAAFSPFGGWKVGAAGPDGPPFFSPMPAPWMGENGSLFRGRQHHLRGIEAEIAFLLGQDVPPRATPYSRGEVIDAIESCHPAIEILESAFVDPFVLPRTTWLADLGLNGGFVAGPAVPQWQEVDWSTETVAVIVDGAIRKEKTGTAPGGPDLLRLVLALVNEGGARTHGLKRGQWITTGSWTGVDYGSHGAEVVVQFGRAGRVSMQFSNEKY